MSTVEGRGTSTVERRGMSTFEGRGMWQCSLHLTINHKPSIQRNLSKRVTPN